MPYGVYDSNYKLHLALNLVRRYLDRNAQVLPDQSGITYSHHKGEKKLMPAKWGDGTPIRTFSGRVIESPQFVRTKCVMSRAAAIQMVNDLSEV